MANNYYRRPPRNLSVEAFLLRSNYPNSKCILKNNELKWFGTIRPSSISKSYKIRIEYGVNFSRPKVVLYGENVLGLDKRNFPHQWRINKERKEVELCLHTPLSFTANNSIAFDIIPWTQEWLFHYEIWLLTGQWLGGGHGSSNNYKN